MEQPRTLHSVEVYRRLTTLANDLEHMAGQCWSVAGETALRAAAKVIRTLASGFWMTITPDEKPKPEVPDLGSLLGPTDPPPPR